MVYDCIIVGAGPAGLHCGTYLGRFRRQALIFNGGKPRAAWIPITHNFPGFPEGITGPELLDLLRTQCESCGPSIVETKVLSIEGEDGSFTVRTEEREVSAKKIVLATGVHDIPPHVPNAAHFRGGTIRHCPVCDAYEASGCKMVVFGSGNKAAKQALWLAHFTDDLTILTCGNGSLQDIDKDLRNKLETKHIGLVEQRVAVIQEESGHLGNIIFEDGSRLEGVYRGYSAMGLTANSQLAEQMGLDLDSNGYIVVHGQQETSKPGVYAIGDIVANQIGQLSIAVGNAAAAATAVHNSLLDF